MIFEPVKSQYINTLTFGSLSGSSCIKMPVELKTPKMD